MDTLKLAKRSVHYLHVPGMHTPHADVTRSFMEFYINDRPLTELLDSFYGYSQKSILDSYAGVLGSFSNKASDVVKAKQLMGKKITEADVDRYREYLSAVVDQDDVGDLMDRLTDELADPEIHIYCCAACGDYSCEHIAVRVVFAGHSVIWSFCEEERELQFEFDKYQYFETLGAYLQVVQR